MEILPRELREKIFSFLGARDLAIAGAVCKAWREFANSDFLWKKLLRSDYPSERSVALGADPTKFDFLEELCYSRRLYDRGALASKRWETGCFRRLSVKPEVVDAELICNGGVVVLLTNSQSLLIYNLNDGDKPITENCLQGIEPKRLYSHEETLVVVCDSMACAIFQWSSRLNFKCFVFAGIQQTLSSGPSVPVASNHDVACLGMNQTTVVFLALDYFHFWSTEYTKSVFRRQVEGDSRVHVTQHSLFLESESGFLEALNPRNGSVLYSLEMSSFGWKEIRDNGSVVVCWDANKIRAWNSSGRPLACNFSASYHMQLHPNMPWIAYLELNDTTNSLVMRNVLTEEVMWRRPLKAFMYVDCIDWRLLLLSKSPATSEVVEWRTGKRTVRLNSYLPPENISSKVVACAQTILSFL